MLYKSTRKKGGKKEIVSQKKSAPIVHLKGRLVRDQHITGWPAKDMKIRRYHPQSPCLFLLIRQKKASAQQSLCALSRSRLSCDCVFSSWDACSGPDGAFAAYGAGQLGSDHWSSLLVAWHPTISANKSVRVACIRQRAACNASCASDFSLLSLSEGMYY